MKLRVCVCGDGSLAHALAAVLGANPSVSVNVLVKEPARWRNIIRLRYLEDSLLFGRIASASDSPEQAVGNCDLVLLAVSHHERGPLLARIAPHVAPAAWIGGVPGFAGFAWQGSHHLSGRRLFGFQRVPYVRSAFEYGREVHVTGVRPEHCVATIPARESSTLARLLRCALHANVKPLPNFLDVCFSRSNSVCHPARIYSRLREWDGSSPIATSAFGFYSAWDDQASELFFKLDAELEAAASLVPLDTSGAQSVSRFYGANSPRQLTDRMRSIRAMEYHAFPVVKGAGGYYPDLSSYHFQEDILYGLVVLKGIFSLLGSSSPVTDSILHWAQDSLGKTIIDGSRLAGSHVLHVAIPQNYGFEDLRSLLKMIGD